ncbi:sulfurtransferase-like selenium metabolism protein YedF [Niveibacterium sp. COAC-50]|uniref:sulfurtransferase-like selenium metabolism protein YedF n=1 Tax=Niveibacterium sp. COAC-50 TaxID=2729384 RepID=UPI0015580546|nr:sulfurtransferase-like selenium metabolism protein YedF [Niveibacterium sp. COAC-50]
MSSNAYANTVIVVGNDGLGHGDDTLRRKVIATYFRTLFESGNLPQAILFYTRGVLLSADDSPCLSELKALSDAGVPLIICRTCLEYFKLMDRVAVGEIGNMLNVIEAQGAAEKVITL